MPISVRQNWKKGWKTLRRAESVRRGKLRYPVSQASPAKAGEVARVSVTVGAL